MSGRMKGVVAGECVGCGKRNFPVSENYMGPNFKCENCIPRPGVLAQTQPLQGWWVSGPQAQQARQQARQAQLARQAELDRQAQQAELNRQQAQLRARQAELDRQQAELDRQQAELGYW